MRCLLPLLQEMRARHGIRFLHCLPLIFLCGLTQHATAAPDTARFNTLLRLGDSIYSQKQGYGSLLRCLPYFDSASMLAERSGDVLMMARATAARGRVYDAWDREPEKTVELFRKASGLFRQAGDEPRYFYYKHLVAHSYEKVRDSLRATAVLRDMVSELSRHDTASLHTFGFIPEMALIATAVHAYPLADSILRILSRREWIANDPGSYNYLDHYYLTQSQLDIYWRRKPASRYLDSLAATFNQVGPLFDRRYYASVLADLYSAVGNYAAAFRYRSIQNTLTDSLMAGRDIEGTQRALEASEAAGERRKLEYEQVLSRSRTTAIWVLALLVAVITVLSLYLYQRTKKYRAQSLHLQELNGKLDVQIAKEELLNKEIQHRVKNNLHMIYSLLQMQERKTNNEEVLCNLQAARLRVESVAELHNQLLNSSSTPDFNAFLKTMISSAVNCLSDEQKVVTHINAQDIFIPVNSYFALSLILNEWVTNSVKYAVAREDMLTINVSIKNEESQVCIQYADSGMAKPTVPAAPGLGTQIIHLLSRQMNGTLTTLHHNPYHYQLCIPHGH